MTATATNLAAPLAHYARRFHAVVGDEHHIASPLGAWLLLALCGPASTGATRRELAEVLGYDVDEAAAVTARLLGQPHPLVAAAAAVWPRADVSTDRLARWLAALPPAVKTGDLPGQPELNRWAREHTFGLIDSFPIQVTPDMLLVLATALATRVSWEEPFDLVPASALGAASPWAGRLDQVLRTPDRSHWHTQFIALTEQAGDVAVHTARARGGLAVTSVVAAPGVAAGDVLAAAYELAARLGAHQEVPRRSLFDLPLGGGPLWTVSERPAMTTALDGREERCSAVLPAWSARSEHDLARPELGLPAAAAALADLLALPDYRYAAVQSAMARYHRVGFEAAAVTAVAMLTSAPVLSEGVLRVAELRFGHPYAVVAVASQEDWIEQRLIPGPWHGVPVFSAWVTDPENATG